MMARKLYILTKTHLDFLIYNLSLSSTYQSHVFKVNLTINSLHFHYISPNKSVWTQSRLLCLLFRNLQNVSMKCWFNAHCLGAKMQNLLSSCSQLMWWNPETSLPWWLWDWMMYMMARSTRALESAHIIPNALKLTEGMPNSTPSCTTW